MKLTKNEKSEIVELFYTMKNSDEYGDKDYTSYFLRKVDNMSRELKLKMVYALLNSGEIEL